MKIYESEKEVTVKFMEDNEGRVAITTDMWTTSNQKKGFMAITAHYIDASWTLQSRILSVDKIRESVVFWKATPKREEKFEEAARHLLISYSKKLVLDVATRWNSTYLMLEIAIVYKSVFARLLRKETSKYKIAITEEDWEFTRELCGRFAVESERILQLVYDLVFEYQSRGTSCSRGVESSGNLSQDMSEGGSQDPLAAYDLFIKNDKRAKNLKFKSELDHYLDEDVLPRSKDFDIHMWWKVNGIKYPILQAIARDFLAIPVSTVASESAFSTGGRLVSIHQDRLESDTVEALMCAHNWLWVEERKGTNSITYATIHDEVGASTRI
ncbi:Zinc finger BED domain-containing protein RICESLEEPER [Quillaja saponaria]|uniref:Zinc finger BED domain-containing protein RICESLEEPER n=1 Tax=Quillaja saponaria TaxID=32244 RepID=A0AAD7VHU8_QUISA|nr:Zinc finger BED domain-containing protein RICESLEEPER [Quillaja saponaria]